MIIIEKNQARIIRLIQLAPDGTFRSRIKLQKILYLLKQASIKKGEDKINIDFSLYNFGPFSFDLAKNTTYYVNAYKIINETQEEGSTWKYSINDVELGKVSNLSSYSYNDLFGLDEEELREQFKKLNGKENNLLELTATIVFLANDMSKKIRDREELKEKVGEIKPHLTSVPGLFDKAYDLAKEYFIN